MVEKTKKVETEQKLILVMESFANIRDARMQPLMPDITVVRPYQNRRLVFYEQ